MLILIWECLYLGIMKVAKATEEVGIRGVLTRGIIEECDVEINFSGD